MNTLPLTPFLATLAADGWRVTLYDYTRLSLALRADGPWTLPRLRGVLLALLVRDVEQEAVFLRRFDSFFPADAAAEGRFAEVDVARALEDLQTLVQAQQPARQQCERRAPAQRLLTLPPQAKPRGWRQWGLLLLLLLIVFVLGGDALRVPSAGLRIPPLEEHMPLPVTPGSETTETPPERLTVELPRVFPEHWQTPMRLAAVCPALLLFYSLWLWHSRRIPQDQPLPYDPHASRRFRLGTLGGTPAPWLDAALLDHLADALGYFQSEAASDRLDVPRSIEATGRHGGIPAMVFQRRQQNRRVLILEDARAGGLAWNPVARELAAGLAQRGVPVLYGSCDGPLDYLRTAEGTVVHLTDLDDTRQAYLLLIFSDSKSLQTPRDALLLETLAHWPMVAWMELREPRFWDESTALVARAGLPVFHATGAGLLQAMSRCLSERSAERHSAPQVSAWRSMSAYGGTDVAGQVEDVLGEALPWGQACAMLQPMSLGLADALRRRFCPELPPERVERLYSLPGTSRSVAGLHFARPVLAALRRGFAVRWEEAQQQDILRFLLEQMQQAEPQESADSLAHLSWSWRLERLRLELEPEVALERLAALGQTAALGKAIRAELEPCVLPGQPVVDASQIPLRLRPQGKDALQRLARLVPESGVPLLEAYPVARWQWGLLGGLVLAGAGFAGVGLEKYWQLPTAAPVQMEFVYIRAGAFMMGAEDGDGDERPVHQVTISQSFYLGLYEVTQAQWESVMGANPSHFTGDLQRPVESVSWEEAQEFVRRLNTQAGRPLYRLPTEAEWEYAARAGKTTAYSFGDDTGQLDEYAWYGKNATGEAHPVGKKKPNAWGLYDMHGNVWEWVQDWYGAYAAAAVTDARGPAAGSLRVIRGGSWFGDARLCRSAARNLVAPGTRGIYLGLRLVRTAP